MRRRSARLVCASHEAQGALEAHLGAHSIRTRFPLLLLPIFSLIVVGVVAPLVLLLVELLFLLPQYANFLLPLLLLLCTFLLFLLIFLTVNLLFVVYFVILSLIL